MLAMFALDPGWVLSVYRWIDGVWDEDGLRTVRTRLRVQVSRLRQVIADWPLSAAVISMDSVATYVVRSPIRLRRLGGRDR